VKLVISLYEIHPILVVPPKLLLLVLFVAAAAVVTTGLVYSRRSMNASSGRQISLLRRRVRR